MTHVVNSIMEVDISRRNYIWRLWVVCLLSSFAVAAFMHNSPTLAQSALERSEGAVGRTMDNYRLIDQDGNFIPFYTYKGRPVLLNFMYTECLGPCQLISANIQKIQNALEPALAEDLMTVSVTIDIDHDKPEVLKEFGQEYTDDFDNWIFARADMETLTRMVEDLGFQYEISKTGMEHMNRITIIGPDGVVKKHFYGMEYDPDEVGNAIRDVVEGRTLSDKFSDSLDWALIYCSNYDPKTKTYRIDYFFIVTVVFQYFLVMGTLIYIFRNNIVRMWMKITGKVAKD